MNVACYVRVSTVEQSLKGYSIGEQTDRLTKFCESQGWNIFKVYTDGGYTGTNMRRPALQEMISDIQRIDKVVVYKLDRLSRSQRDTLTLIEDIFIPNNTDLVSMNESFDTSTAFGRFMIGILSTFAQLEKSQISERMTMGKDARAKEGKWHGGTPPKGYIYENGELIVDDFLAMQIREIFQRYNEGEPLRSIERDFLKRGYSWNPKTMRRIISNKTYCGYIKYKNEWIVGHHQPIIDEDTFQKASTRLRISQSDFAESGIQVGKNTTLLGGLIFCTHCGGRYGKAMSGSKRYGLHEVYKCYSRHKKVKSMIKNPDCKNKTWSVAVLDDMILSEIKKLTLEDIKKRDSVDADILRKELAKIESQIKRYLQLYGTGRYDLDTLDGLVLPLEQKKMSIEDELKRIPEEEDIDLPTLQEAVDTSSFDDKRQIVESLIQKIVIDGDDITIFWKFK
jgi:site-specific DNA recombinase